jgi:hypothetical protein
VHYEQAFELRLALRPVLTRLNEILRVRERLREAGALEIAGRLGDLRLRLPTTTYLEVAWRSIDGQADGKLGAPVLINVIAP